MLDSRLILALGRGSLMGVNLDKPHLWKVDVATSVAAYNAWFMRFAPQAFRDARGRATGDVRNAFVWTADLTRITPAELMGHPTVLFVLRMATTPPLARDRLIGLSGADPHLVHIMEKTGITPKKMMPTQLNAQLAQLCDIIRSLLDVDICTWLGSGVAPNAAARELAASIIADRMCGASADPIIRNAQEARQLALIERHLVALGYANVTGTSGLSLSTMQPGTFAIRLNVPVTNQAGRDVNIPADVAVKPKDPGQPPLLIEAKSAGDYTKPNKRRKEEAQKMTQLHATYGGGVRFVLFLCGYFDSGYLGYEAAEGIDWVWEHRITDLGEFGL